jgi:hypothetical protein
MMQRSQPKIRLRRSAAVVAVLLLGWLLNWQVWRHLLLLERPGWMFSMPSDAQVVATLPSARGIDYRHLRNLLQRRQWREADRETQVTIGRLLSLRPPSETDRAYSYMLPSSDQRRASIVHGIPCTDLLTQDRLWSMASEGRFGFNAQRRITEVATRALGDAEGPWLPCLIDCPPRKEWGSALAIATQMGRGLDAPSRTPPPGHYPAPPTVVLDLEDTTYRHLARRLKRCGI